MRKHTVYLRNAINQFNALSFDELPLEADDPETKLSRQSHSYSRLFTGAFYDIMVGVYEQLRQHMADLIAIHRARDIMGYTLVCAVELGPVGEFDFSDMAKAFLAADTVINDAAYQQIMIEVFDKRGILSETAAREFLKMLRELPPLSLPDTLNSALASALFLEQQILPALNMSKDIGLIPLNAYRNAWGYAYLSYFVSRRITLSGAEYGEFDGAQVDVFGGLTLMFDDKGRLRSVIERLPTDEDIRQIRVITADVIKAGLIVDQHDPSVGLPLHYFFPRRREKPKALALPNPNAVNLKNGESIIVRFPVLFDVFAPRGVSLREYIQILLRRI